MAMQNLANLSSSELKAFLDSFDNILCDCDGVVWTRAKPIPGIRETLFKLKDYGKQIGFVSNNCTMGMEIFRQRFINTLQLKVDSEHITYPTEAIIDYLKKIKFNKEIFVMGTTTMKNEFRREGFIVTDSETDRIDESFEEVKKTTKDDTNIGAVVFDYDFNLSYIKIQKAMSYLQRPDVLFIAGATDKLIPVGLDNFLLGPGSFQQILQDYTGKMPLTFGKPGLDLNSFIVEKFKIQDPSRTLFIGDSLEQDMKFASKCNYQKLLVLTGVTSLKEAKTCVDKTKIADYYINSMGEIHGLIKNKLEI